jgi:ligand-binding sensor domain-containing protein
MSSKDYKLDLPVPVGVEDLPIPVADTAPQQEQPSDKAFLEWSNLASQRHVRNLAFDPTHGDLWLATGGGILHWKLELNRFVRYASEHGLPGNSVLAVSVDGMGQVWAAHEQFGIYYLKNDTWRPYRILGEVKVSCLTLDSTGKLWAGTASGIYAINTPDRKPAMELLPADIWLCNAQGVYNYKDANWVRTSDSVQPDVLTLARQGENLWLGTFRGLVCIDLSTNKLHKIDTTYPGEVTALDPHLQGVWAACGGQVGLATETGWTPLTEKRFNASITSLLAGRDDQVWIGTHDGLLRGENKQILLHLTDNPPDVIGLASREKSPPTFSSLVQALSVQQFADRSILWIGTALGLFRYDLFTESWRRYGQLASQDIRAIITSQDQETVWVASWSSGLHGLKQQNELQTAPNISEPILTLTAGSDRYWAVGLDGLYQYKDSAWIQVISNKELSRGWLQAIAQAVTDHVWLGTSVGLLLFKIDTKRLTPITGNLGSADVRSLLAINRDESEQVWVGTSQGLYVGNVDNWKLIPELENRVTTALVWDKNNSSLWVGTDRGLFCLLSQGNAWKMVNEFNIHNSGLGANRVTALTISIGEDKETKLWVGTPSGLSCYTY